MKHLFIFILLVTLLAACGTPATPAPAVAPPEATATPMPTDILVEPTATTAPTAMPMAVKPSPFNISVAQYFMDTAGFHGMAETLAETKTIDATYVSTVNRVKKVLEQITWPEELHEQAETFIASLGDFATALGDDKVDDAITLSETVHDAQHELSHAIDDWMASATATTTEADPFNVSVAQYFLDSAGFHGMSEALAETKTIDASYVSTVNRVKKVLDQTTWPEELHEQAETFIASLGEFATALGDDKVDDAIPLSETVHDAQHDLSHAIDEWIVNAKPVSTDADPFKVSVAQYLLDSAGFHGIEETLAETNTIDATYPSRVSRVLKVLTQTVWPEELNEQAQAFVMSLNEFSTALSDDNVEDAITLSETVHDAQHDLSHAIGEWMGIDAEAH
jgi:hypothetical protein